MPSTEKIRADLQKKLSELFQLDQPDLDFGFYRIMHAKAEEVGNFINADLLKDVEETFGKIDDAKKAELKAQYENAMKQARDFGAPDPEAAQKVKEAKAAYESYKTGASAEADVYDHLLRFFSRYYETGDFISRRYYARETAGKAAPFAVPYNGEEVKLHWANADQYYVKSTDYFSNYTFDLNQGTSNGLLSDEKREPLRMHFRIVDASEGEHGNIKTAANNKRFFILHEKEPFAMDENGELVVHFEYRNDPKKTGQDGTWQDRRNAETVETLQKKLGKVDDAAEYRSSLFALAPTEKNPQRSVLAKYLAQYTARNTMDFFIHKNLGEFLHRELDFYIKNEVMRLDDIDGADAPAVQSYLEKIKVIRKIGGKLIDFLAQLEDFQKKLWLKKKFVTETNYCITLDRIDEKFYKEITANKAQHAEWIELFAIDKIEKTLATPGYTKKLSVEFLKANDKLVLDTRHFDAGFKARLIESITNFDDQCDGLLIHSENFQALNLLQERYREQIKCVYIDPPYNSGDYDIPYKNGYKHSSWLSLIENRVTLSQTLLDCNPVFFLAIDDYEMAPLCSMLDSALPQFHREMAIINHHPQGGKATTLSNTHEYLIVLIKKTGGITLVGRDFSENDVIEERPFKRSGTAESNHRFGRPNSFYALLVDPKSNLVVGAERPPEKGDAFYLRDDTKDGQKRMYPIGNAGIERVWRRSYESCLELIHNQKLKCSGNGTIYQLIEPNEKTTAFFSNWTDKRYNASTYGANLLKNIIGRSNLFAYPKSLYTLIDTIFSLEDDNLTVLDYFSGSGTTGHAVIDLNREDEGSRRYILVEMGDHFNTVLTPRMKKVVYCTEWKDGKPQNRDSGISHCFKYIRLESYEDTLNNLRFDDTPAKSKLLQKSKSLREDYMLHYMLDVETQGSQSLLNIDAFAEPDKYLLRVKEAASDATAEKAVDLLETFNYLLGLRVEQIQTPQRFHAEFKRLDDPDIPEDQQKKLVLDGPLKQNNTGDYSFRAVYGWVPKNPFTPNDGLWEKVLIVWRNLTGDLEKDNTVLDEWFRKNRINPRDFEFDTIYINGSNNLPNIKRDDENWRVKLIEEEFFKRMWNVETL